MDVKIEEFETMLDYIDSRCALPSILEKDVSSITKLLLKYEGGFFSVGRPLD